MPIEGTYAEAYLVLYRGIYDQELVRSGPHAYADRVYCSKDRCHLPALLNPIHCTKTGRFLAYQVTYLNDIGQKNTKLKHPRIIRGPYSGGAVFLRYDRDVKTTIIGEGVETCLSLAVTFKNTNIFACLNVNNISNFTPPPGCRRLIVASDGDLPESQAGKALEKSFDNLKKHNIGVRLVKAPAGKDWNDLCMEKSGIEKIRREFEGQLRN